MAKPEQAGTLRDTYDVWLAALGETYSSTVQAVVAQLPQVIGAALLALTGWLLAVGLRAFVLRVGTGVDSLLNIARERAGLPPVDAGWPASRALATAGYWLVLLFFVTVAVRILGLQWLAQVIREVLLYLPLLLGSAAVLLAAYIASVFVRDNVESTAARAGLPDAALLGRLARVGVLALVVVIVLDQIGIAVSVLESVVTVLFAALVGAMALAFGLGARESVRNVLAGQHVRRRYRVGQRVRVEQLEGEILELTPVSVVLDTADGRAHVPTHLFADNVSLLLDDDHQADNA